jgi:hypothetical protein
LAFKRRLSIQYGDKTGQPDSIGQSGFYWISDSSSQDISY